MTELSGRSILITGASQGIGAATARHFAQLGARVMLTARNAAALDALQQSIAAEGGEAQAHACDVSQAAEVERLIARCVEAHGGLDVLVNNAGVIEPIGPIGELPPPDWARVIDINLGGVYNAVHHSLPIMLAAGGGTIINISSGAANAPLEGWSHYCASKAAAQMLTRCIDLEYRERGIRAIGLSPGTVATDMQVAIRASGINRVSQLSPDSHIPPEWVAQGIAWLCDPAADEFLGTDFSLKTPDGRARVGLPPPG